MFGRYIQPQLSPVSFSRCATMVHTRDPPCTTTMVVAWPPEHCGVGTIAHLVPGVPRRARTALPRRLGGAEVGSLPTAIASHRFFFAASGRSNSIVDSSETAAGLFHPTPPARQEVPAPTPSPTPPRPCAPARRTTTRCGESRCQMLLLRF